MPFGIEALEAAVDAALAAEDGQKSVQCLSTVVEALRTQANLAESFLLSGASEQNGPSRDYLRVTSAFERLVTKGSSPWFAQLADLLRGAAAEVMPILPRRPFAQSDFSEQSDANVRHEEADMDVQDPADPDKESSSGTGSTEEPKEDAAEMLDVDDMAEMDVDDEPSMPSVTWLSALLSAILPLLTNALPRDQNEVCIIPHPHKMERQEAAEDTMHVHLGTSRWRPVFNTKKICDNCGTRITDRFYYHCSENCDIDFCQDCHTRSGELLDAFMAEVDEVNDEHLSRRLFWVIDITERIGWYVLHLNVADRRRLAHELAFSWPTVLFERLAQAAVDVVNARVVHVQDVKDIQSDERFWHAVGWLQFLYSTNELPCKTRRLEEQSSRGPKVDYERFVLDGINKCEPLSEFQRWRKHPSATVPKVLDVRSFKITNDFCSFLTHSNLVPVNFRRVCLLCDVWEQMQGRIVPLHLEVPREPQRLVHAVMERFCESLKDADLRQPLRVCFQDEEAGGPGVTKEFFQVALRSFLDACHNNERLFVYDEQSRTYWLNERSVGSEDFFRSYGILLGQAVLNHIHVPNIFPRALYDRLLEELESPCAKKLRLEDIGAVCPHIAKSLRQILEYTGQDIAEKFGDLAWPRGSPQLPEDLQISQANKADFVQAYVDWFFHGKIEAQLKPLSEGFKTILGGSSLLRTIVDAVQLEKIVCGRADNVDVDAIRSSAELEGWTEEDRLEYLPWLWEVLASVSPAEKAQFLIFVTASDRVPLKGWQSLGLIVQKNGVGDERLPSAYTCFSQLLLPRFSTKEKLRNGLLLAIANSEGFGLP
ncbi:Herc4 [Symbiodinium natans]|uniref:HECT-type E3 ubiquitin transferase n=1 Tax=Symbiodinium natans TaxID=878477 RepID=A0A812NYU3_9DINO|nr:Herc4 [Symbiodinium natans]